MKKIILAFAGFSLLLASCTELDVPLGVGSKTLNDTTYLAAAEKPQTHNALLEEFTGSSCANCPQARTVIEGLLVSYPSTLNVISIHPFNFPQGAPYAGHHYDFRTDKGTTVGATIYGGINGMPGGGVDRTIFASNLQLTRDQWGSAIAARTSTNNGINMYATSHYNPVAAVDTIAITIAYTQASTNAQNLSIAIVEDSLYDVQEDGLSVDTNYLYNDVFRDMVTSVPYGDGILTGTPATIANKEAGRVVKLYYLYKVPAGVYNPQQCRVIAFVTDGASGTIDVLQSVQTPFVGH